MQLKASKDWAVFIAVVLVFFALVLARVLPLVLPKDTPALELLANAFFMIFSWDILNALIGGAIDTAKGKEVKSYLTTQTSEGIYDRQNLGRVIN